jgi:proline dehydrogenase
MISFDNTAIAFQSKSNKDLQKAYWLFRIVGNPSLVKIGKNATNMALNLGLPIKGLIRKTIFNQFCGGESIEHCALTIATLHKYGIGTILDYSVEGKTSNEDFDATVQEIKRTIDRAAKDTSIPFAVFKVTGIARFGILEKANDSETQLNETEREELAAVCERIDQICQHAYQNNVPVFIDAEETWIQDVIDRISMQMMEKYNAEKAIVYNTLQMYRHDRLDFLRNSIVEAKDKKICLGIKLVRGAYMEKERERAQKMGYPSPIQADKKSSDNDFNEALEVMIENISCVAFCAGTHNEASSLLLTELMTKQQIESNDKRIYFAQLLGMSDHISYNLSYHGYNVAKYVPYGPIKEVMPYLLRRADENTSVAGQTSRELSLIIKEKERRRKKEGR